MITFNAAVTTMALYFTFIPKDYSDFLMKYAQICWHQHPSSFSNKESLALVKWISWNSNYISGKLPCLLMKKKFLWIFSTNLLIYVLMLISVFIDSLTCLAFWQSNFSPTIPDPPTHKNCWWLELSFSYQSIFPGIFKWTNFSEDFK